MRILFLSRWFPAPLNNGSKLRVYNLLKALAHEHQLTLLSFSDPANDDVADSEIHALCECVRTVPWKTFDPLSWRSQLAFLSPAPRSVVASHSLEMSELIRERLARGKFDLVIASQVGTAAYRANFKDLPALLEEVELALLYERYLRADTMRNHFRSGLTWWKYRRYVSALLRGFRACTVVSDRERSLLAKFVGDDYPIEVIPNSIHLQNYQGFEVRPEEYTLIFTGSFRYGPNYEAMRWFLEKIYPRIQVQVPHVSLKITGDHVNMPLPVYENVELTGFVDDVRPLISSSWISLAPILSGGGTRFKILEAMALRTPVIATSKGAEGLSVQHEENIMIADTANDFVSAVVRLLHEPDTRRRIAQNAYRLVSEIYDWTKIRRQFLELVHRTAES